jgi:hypothetical protein
MLQRGTIDVGAKSTENDNARRLMLRREMFDL